MSATELRRSFRRQFRAVARQIWSLRVLRGAALTVVATAALLALVAAADYTLELSWAVRAAALGVGVIGVAVLAARWVVWPAREWNRERVAAELEGLFPRLGQRLRTAAELGARPAAELAQAGVSPALVAALEEETAEKVKPLPFQAALPVRPALLAGFAALVCVAAVVAGAVGLPEWRTAMKRAALAPTTYTTLTASASADAVDENADVEIRATQSGRARAEVVLHVREAGDTEWRQETMEAVDGAFTAKLSRLRATTEFYAAAGPEKTAVQTIVVRHALKIISARAEVASPAYTGVPVASVESGTFSGLVGSVAKVRFQLDRAPVSAELVLRNPAKPKDAPQRVPLTLDGKLASTELRLTTDLEYSVEARDADNMPLVPNRFRVRVTADQPPAVTFDTPGENMEVHTLAEVLMRARARDDFGLTKVGIVFQVNNEEERALVLLDVDKPNQRELKAEQVLLLEQFLLTQKDCVAYYAFAEDNHPDGPQRVTTELRFIDIRPFQRTYRLMDAPDEVPGGPRRELIFLDEVIARQRFNLNQTIRLEARAKVRLDPGQVEKIAAFQNKLATQTHDLADFLSGLGVDGAAILAQAEEAMLLAVDSLNADKFATAVNQERDALRYLMEARETAQQALFRQPPKVRAQARAFDRLQRQKLRRPNEQAETLAQIAGELAKLADDEEGVARDIAGPLPMGTNGPGGAEPKTEPKTAKGEDPAQERQDDVAGRATGLEKAAANAKGLTALAKERIAEATKAANAGADALGKGDRPTARKDVDRAKELFRTASKQVAALAADEAAQQLAAARDLANEIAAMTAPPTDTKAPGPGGMGDEKVPGLGGAAEQAKSLKDVLENLAASGAAADADAARKAAGLLKEANLQDAIERLNKPGAGDDKAERQDLAERFGALGQKLDQAYREAVAPRLEELSKLERAANDLEQRAAAADDAADFRRLAQQGTEFVDRLDAAGLGALVGDEVRNALRGPGTEAGRAVLGRGFAAAHTKLLSKLQEFVNGDRFTTGTEAVPPEYRDLVERYQRALSGGTK
ncbi:Uncharacterized protein OS=Gemmatimonadetes bacterium KBS708 GN=J421_5211 PE=4 SV=1 [Gemmata massiliana]|uniref:DUF4175 family protein n=1 Tax=Gemmata massiliana TaxID=1210884 RepID=A0A6P2D4E3_9BACT|nr:DUF4175 family protein [Gemmata massiliana]VTR96168.1 Uncharacterized protein OS=Gemmatimonadetes bacterium KBS708 GN=J421_5211 PE=4 SV=1 [Gemmata massiliana]